MQVTYQRKFESAVSCFSLNQKNTVLGIGLAMGKAIFKKRKSSALEFYQEENLDQFSKNFFASFLGNSDDQQFKRNYRYYTRGIYQKPTTYDLTFDSSQTARRLKKYDNYLKKF